mmetsp:Transcript_3941/g.10942  ORF Transcript_3941/g.10942 Transcript_3941/m.10942 type:complete len:203 (-) Transcript_3941:7-615(-)
MFSVTFSTVIIPQSSLILYPRKDLLSFSSHCVLETHPAVCANPVYPPLMVSIQSPPAVWGPCWIVQSTVPVFTASSITVLKVFRSLMSMPVILRVLPTNGVKALLNHSEASSDTTTPKYSAAASRSSFVPTLVFQPSTRPGSVDKSRRGVWTGTPVRSEDAANTSENEKKTQNATAPCMAQLRLTRGGINFTRDQWGLCVWS